MATKDLDQAVLDKQSKRNHRTGAMWDAQLAARIKRSQVLPNGETFRVKDRHAFLMEPDQSADSKFGKPWIFYLARRS